MKKVLSIALTALILTTGIVACKLNNSSETTASSSADSSTLTTEQSSTETAESSLQNGDVNMENWIIPEDIAVTTELESVFSKAMDGFVGVGYTPKIYLGCIQSGGTIHCFLCESVVIVPDAVPYWSLVYIFEDAEGNSAITGIYVPLYSTSGDTVVVQDNPTELMPGGWSYHIEQDIDVNDLLEKAFPDTEEYSVSDYTGKLLLATQVVAGTNYAVLCETDGTNKDSKLWTIVYIYKDLQGNCELLNISLLDIGAIYGPLVWNGPGEDYRDVCLAYLEEYSPDSIDTIININNPTVIMMDELPDSYFVVTTGDGVAPYYSYCYQTTNDGLWGPIEFFIDSQGTIMGLAFRE